MKKKVIITMLLTMGVLTIGAVEAGAYTVTGRGFSVIKGPDAQETYDWDDVNDVLLTVGDGDEWDADDVNYYRQKIKESIAYLEKYGVTYDVRSGSISYEGRKVNWIVDESRGEQWIVAGNSDGEIGLFVKRNEDYEVTGVRVADEKEFEKYNRDYDQDVVMDVPNAAVAEEECTETIVQGSESYDSMYDYPAFENSETIFEGDFYQEEADKTKEYERAGIIADKDGSWLWKGQQVRMLLDDDGSFYTNGRAKAEKDNIYLIVSRDAYGDISKVEELSSKELMAILAKRDN